MHAFQLILHVHSILINMSNVLFIFQLLSYLCYIFKNILNTYFSIHSIFIFHFDTFVKYILFSYFHNNIQFSKICRTFQLISHLLLHSILINVKCILLYLIFVFFFNVKCIYNMHNS